MILLDIRVARPRLQHSTSAHMHTLKTSFRKELGAGEFSKSKTRVAFHNFTGAQRISTEQLRVLMQEK